MSVFLLLDVSGGELLVVLLFVLLFFGSKGVPEVARTMGRALRQFRDASAEVQREIEKGANDVKKGFEEQKRAFRIEPPEHAAPQKPVQQTEAATSSEPPGPASSATTSRPVRTPEEDPGKEGRQ
ncbi:MAG: twin-arginine translocase TatA/TatE family subunit [Flavobacteriales bacterium]